MTALALPSRGRQQPRRNCAKMTVDKITARFYPRQWPCWLAFMVLLLGACTSEPHTTALLPIRFTATDREAGLDFHHQNGARGDYYYVETFGAGAAFLDFDGDGWQDIYLIDGGPLNDPTAAPTTNRLFHNNGQGHFTPVAAAADTGYGMGVAAADYDNDGDQDLYITNFGPNALYRNDGQGQFTEVTATWNAGDIRWGTSCAFLDYDSDGDLDLFIANYVDFALDANILCQQGGHRAYCPPDQYEPTLDLLYRNDGDRFTDVSHQSGITVAGRGLGIALSDYDLDGDTDIYVANDGTMNVLYRNDGDHFAEVSLQAGVRYDRHGRAEAGMGVDFGDYDNDGDADLFVTNFAYETNSFYHNQGQGRFRHFTQRLGLVQSSFRSLGFGTKFHDYDNDGDLDLFVANGHVADNIALFDSAQTYAQADQLLRNDQRQGFTDITASLGPDLPRPHPSRGTAIADSDNDGDLDLLVTTVGGRPRLLRNDGGNQHHWLIVHLIGAAQKDALGTRVTLTTPDGSQTRQRQSGGSYLSSHDPRLHFGLGRAQSADLDIVWPDGQPQQLRQVTANQILHIQQPPISPSQGQHE
ncbi:MAG: hypothetical protein GKR89_20000 [Candidatus Latescibacteria bacterium]|nr:hypothetical protein [Candidatus Latescibacterota bacterium]